MITYLEKNKYTFFKEELAMSRDYYSVVNQKILRDFVDREVIMCATDIVEYILQSQLETGSADAPFSEIS